MVSIARKIMPKPKPVKAKPRPSSTATWPEVFEDPGRKEAIVGDRPHISFEGRFENWGSD